MEFNRQNPRFFDYISLILFSSGLMIFYLPASIMGIFFDDVDLGSAGLALFILFGILTIDSVLVTIYSIIKNRVRWWRVALFAFEVIMLMGWIFAVIYVLNMGTCA